MTVRDINCCSNIWHDSEVIIDNRIATIYKGRFSDIPKELEGKEVWFWNCTNLAGQKDVPVATKVFIALR